MPDEIGLFEAMYTQRALRYIKPDPIPDDLVRRVIDAGIHAPNGGNQQRWGFVVIKDPDVKRKIAERYKDTDRPAHTRPPDASSARNDHSANYLADHLADVPVVILCCVRRPGGEGSGSDIGHGASIYPAVQNMLLAARGLGLASVLTTRPRRWLRAGNEGVGGCARRVRHGRPAALGIPRRRLPLRPHHKAPHGRGDLRRQMGPELAVADIKAIETRTFRKEL